MRRDSLATRRESLYEPIGEEEEEHLVSSVESSVEKTEDAESDEEQDPPSYVDQFAKPVQIAIIASLFMGGLNMGLNLSIMGPVMPDLQLITGTTPQMMSTIFIWRAAAFMAGSISSGFIVERMNGFLFVAIALVFQAASRMITPFMTHILALSAVNAVSIYFSTCVITCTSFLVFQTFTGKKTRIMVQLVFLVFQIGKVITPFIIWPFLADDVGRNVSTTVTEAIIHPPHSLWLLPDWALWVLKFPETMLGDRLYKNETVWVELPPITHVQYVFVIVGCFSILMSTVYIYVFFSTGCVFSNPFTTRISKKDFQKKPGAPAAPADIDSPPLHIVISFFIMTSFIGGVEATDSGVLMTFVVEFLGWTKDKGIFMMAMYQFVKVVACVCFMPFVRRIRPSIILTADYSFLGFASIVMAITIGTNGSPALLWISVAAFALGGSNIYATNFTFLETRYTVGGRMSSLFTVSLGMGMMIFPFTTTALMALYGPIFYPLTLLFAISSSFIVFCITKVLMGEGLCCWKRKQHEEAVVLLEKSLTDSTSVEVDYEAIRKHYTENYHQSPMVRRGRLSVDWLATRDKM